MWLCVQGITSLTELMASMVMLMGRMVTPSLAAKPNRRSVCPSANTSASPICWSCTCAEQKRVSEVSFDTFIFTAIFINFFFILSAVEEEEELKKSAVVNWYLKEIESEIDSEEELVNKKGLIEKVLHRLVHYVSPTSKPLVSLQQTSC